MNQSEKVQDFLREVVEDAGAIIESLFGTNYKIGWKNTLANRVVTQADLASEQMILERIRDLFPGDAIISEEAGFFDGIQGNSSTWIVDPLDGTWNYTQGIRNCGTMIALAKGKEVVSSVIYNPFKKLLIQANRGEGILLNGSRFQPQNIHKPPNTFIVDEGPWQSRFSTSKIGHYCLRSAIDNAIEVLHGGAAAYFNRSAKKWDLAPISLIFEEMGLVIGDSYGQKYVWSEERGLIAASAQDFARVLHLLK